MKRVLCLLAAAATLAACDQPQMAEQPKYGPYAAAPGWPEDQAARRPPAGTVARDADLGERPETIPVPVDRRLLARGRGRFDTFCAPCHGRTGHGDGMIVQRGFPAPPSLHEERLRETSLRHYFDVISDGYGVMYSYAARVAPGDRWAIAAYIRALQISQHTPVETLSAAERARLDGGEGTP